MTTEPSESGDPEEQSEACQEARRGIARFVTGDKDGDGQRGPDFRSHLTQCKPCMQVYREMMASAARVGRALREQREDHDRTTRRTGMRKRAIDATAGGKRKNRFGLRLALLPAGIAVLLLLFRLGGGDELLYLHWSGGTVRAAGQLLDADRPQLLLSAGDWCHTQGNARARVAAGSVAPAEGQPIAFELGLETHVFFVSPKDHHVRLERGELTTDGVCRVTTGYGILEPIRGRARIRVSQEGFRVECLTGELVWIGPMGERRLVAGESWDRHLVAQNEL